MDLRRRHAVIAALAGGAICVLLVLTASFAPPALITSIPTGEPIEVPPPTQEIEPMPGATIAPPLPADPDQTIPGVVWGVLGAILAVLVGIALILIAVRAARAIAARVAADPIGDVVDAPPVDVRHVSDVLRRAQEQIALDDDADRAVIRCWESLEALGAAAGIPRADNETAAEYVVGILAAVAAPADAANELAQLYARALFSADRLPTEAVGRARDCLMRLDAALVGAHVAPPAAPATEVP